MWACRWRSRSPRRATRSGASRSIPCAWLRSSAARATSTTYPGTTRDKLVPMLEELSGLKAGEEFNVAFSPERVDPGRTDYTLRNTPKIVGGLTPACLDRALAFYSDVCDNL